MTVNPENRFKCDRCGDEATMPMANTAMPRPAPPEGWLIFNLNKLDVMHHLCSPCAFGFNAYMSGASISSNVGDPDAKGSTLPP